MMATPAPDHSLESCLAGFRSNVNGHPRLKSMLAGWCPHIVVEATDSGECFTLVVDANEIRTIAPGELAGPWMLRVEAEEAVLKDVFDGRRNPAAAYLDGELAVFGNDKDQVKLDAITLVIWGM